MKNKMNIVFMGTPDFCIPALELLCQHGYTPSAVYTQTDKVRGRNKKVSFSPVKEFAVQHNIPVYQPRTFKDEAAVEELSTLHPDLIIVIAYGKILPQAVLDIPQYGCLNVHASLLPKYRGAAPIQRVILNGEKETGVTIMKLDAGMDTGPMIDTAKMEIPAHITAGELFDALGKLGANLLLSVLDDLPRKLAHAVPQNEADATYAEKVTKDMGHIDWDKPADELDRLIRGLYPDPGTYTFFRKKRMKLHRAHKAKGAAKGEAGTILSTAGGELTVACGEGALAITSLQQEGKKQMDASDFINGYQVKANDHFDE